METKIFLESLLGYIPEDQYALIWTLRGSTKKSRFVSLEGLEGAVEYIEQAKKEHDVYVGVGLSPEDFGEYKRCPQQKISGIMGLWLDVDIADPVHKKPNLPPDEESAKRFIDSLGITPTFIIHSGHGYQVWWLFKEPWIFEKEGEREEAMDLSLRWLTTVRLQAKKKGWDVDSTQDLSRVMRIPGTYNRKKEPKEVRVIMHEEGLRYDPAEFEPFISEGAAKSVEDGADLSNVDFEGMEFTLNPRATPPFDKFEALCGIEPKVKDSWERSRKELQDQSASSYDISLANFAVMAEWTDQEIVDLLIASRRKHGDDLKLRADYYGRTIAKARANIARIKAEKNICELSCSDEMDIPDEESREERRKTLLGTVSALFGVNIQKITKYLSDPPQYRLSTQAGSILLGDVSNLIGQANLRNKVASATGRYIPKMKGDKWDQIAQALLDVCVEEDVGSESTDRGMVESWLGEYLEERRPIEHIEEAVEQKSPFVKDGEVYIFASDLRKWLSVTRGEKIPSKSLGTFLRSADCVPEVVGVMIDEKRTTRSVWKISSELVG